MYTVWTFVQLQWLSLKQQGFRTQTRLDCNYRDLCNWNSVTGQCVKCWSQRGWCELHSFKCQQWVSDWYLCPSRRKTPSISQPRASAPWSHQSNAGVWTEHKRANSDTHSYTRHCSEIDGRERADWPFRNIFRTSPWRRFVLLRGCHIGWCYH